MQNDVTRILNSSLNVNEISGSVVPLQFFVSFGGIVGFVNIFVQALAMIVVAGGRKPPLIYPGLRTIASASGLL